MPRRRLHPSECSFIIWTMELTDTGKLLPDAQLHLVRETVNGNDIIACGMGQMIYDGGSAYYRFPFLRFIAELAPICPKCAQVMERERLIQTTRKVLAETP